MFRTYENLSSFSSLFSSFPSIFLVFWTLLEEGGVYWWRIWSVFLFSLSNINSWLSSDYFVCLHVMRIIVALISAFFLSPYFLLKFHVKSFYRNSWVSIFLLAECVTSCLNGFSSALISSFCNTLFRTWKLLFSNFFLFKSSQALYFLCRKHTIYYKWLRVYLFVLV